MNYGENLVQFFKMKKLNYNFFFTVIFFIYTMAKIKVFHFTPNGPKLELKNRP